MVSLGYQRSEDSNIAVGYSATQLRVHQIKAISIPTMNKVLLFISFFFYFGGGYAQQQHFLEYEPGKNISGLPAKARVTVRSTIIENVTSKVLSEQQAFTTDSVGNGLILVGKAVKRVGNIDSIMWSIGSYELFNEIDTAGSGKFDIIRRTTIRVPPDLTKDYEQGTISATDFPTYGEWSIPNIRNKRPRLVHIDLSTSYANLAYPADTYPVYRHFEWLDEDRNGLGNAFMLSYSDHTNHSFRENTDTLGLVKLYSSPFQVVSISSNSQRIDIKITEPVPVKNLSETYAIKGPWKFIYYIEW